MSDRIFYPYYNYTVEIDYNKYDFTGIHEINVEETWKKYMSSVEFTTEQIMAEMDISEIKKGLEMVEFNLNSETLTAT